MKYATDFDKEADKVIRKIATTIHLDTSDYRTPLLFNKSTKVAIEAILFDVYNQGYDAAITESYRGV